MSEIGMLRDFGYVIVAAALFALIARPLRMPAIMAYILAGLALGPLSGLYSPTESVERFSEVGIALLLFLVGLELSLAQIRGVGRAALLAGMGQVGITAALGFGLATLLGFAPAPAALLGLAVTFSSTVVVVKLLDSRGELDATYGRIAVGVLLVQDFVVVIVLTLLAGLGTAQPEGGNGLVGGLVRAFGGTALLAAVAFLSARWLLPRPFAWLGRSLEGLLIWSLCWCFLFIVGAEALGLSVELGAFLAGISLAQLPYNHELRRRVQPLVHVFVAVFFVTLGAHMELGAAAQHWVAALALSALVLIGKPLALMLLVPRLGYGERTSFMTGIALGQISEFSFILAALGLAAGLLDDSVLSLIGIVGIVTIGVSSYLLTYGSEVYDFLASRGMLRPLHATTRPESEQQRPLTGHVIVVGMNSLGRRIVQALAARGEHVVAIDTDPGKLRDLPALAVLGNADDDAVLQEANLPAAKLLVTALQIEDANTLLAYRCRRQGVPVSVHAFEPGLAAELDSLGVDYVMVSKHDGIRQVAAELRRAHVLD